MIAPETTRTPSAIEWPKPKINDPRVALEDALCRIERLRALLSSNNDDVLDVVLSDEGTPAFATKAWMIYGVAEEKLGEVYELLSAINEEHLRRQRSAIATHNAHVRQTAWRAAVAAYLTAEAVPVSEGTPDSVFDAAAAAFKAMCETRAPDLSALREKIDIIERSKGWSASGSVDAVAADVDFLIGQAEREVSSQSSEGTVS